MGLNRRGVGTAAGFFLLLATMQGKADEGVPLPHRERNEKGGDRPLGPAQRFIEEVDHCPGCREDGICVDHAERFGHFREKLREAPTEVRERVRAWCERRREQIRERMKERFDANKDGELGEAERAAARGALEKKCPGLLKKLRERHGDARGTQQDGGPRDWREDVRDHREDARDRREGTRDRREDVRDHQEDIRDARHDGGCKDRAEDVRDRREDHRDRREDVRDRREDFRDARDRDDWNDDRHWNLFDCLEDARDAREDLRDRREDYRDGRNGRGRGGRK